MPAVARRNFLAQAEALLASRPGASALSPETRQHLIASLARHLALSASPIGTLAKAVSSAAEQFADTIHAFLSHYPTDESASQACRHALAEAELSGRPGDEYGPDHFRHTPEALQHLLFALEEWMYPVLTHCDPPRRFLGDDRPPEPVHAAGG